MGQNRILTIDINVYDGMEVHSTGFSTTADKLMTIPDVEFAPAVKIISEHLKEHAEHEANKE